MKTGKLIVLEGTCGAGKSTVAQQIVTLLQSKGIKTVYNHGALSFTDIGSEFKELIQYYPELLSTSYYVADLVQVTLRYIKPWLDEGYYVIQDRYSDSIVSYVRALARLKGQTADIQRVIDLYMELRLLEVPDCVIWCRASNGMVFDRLSSSDESHHKYIKNPNLVGFVQEEFALIMEQRLATNQVFILQTDKPIDSENIIEMFRLVK